MVANIAPAPSRYPAPYIRMIINALEARRKLRELRSCVKVG